MLHTTAVLDANVLMTRYLRDFMLSLAERRLFQPKWSPDLLGEMTRAIERRAGNSWDARRAERIARTLDLMNRAFPDANVEGYAEFVQDLHLPDPDDRHVLAAALAGKADLIVTFNLSDFPASTLAPHGVEALHPDAFVAGLIHADAPEVLHAIQTMTRRWRRPEVDLHQAIELFRTRWGPLPRSMTQLRHSVALGAEE